MEVQMAREQEEEETSTILNDEDLMQIDSHRGNGDKKNNSRSATTSGGAARGVGKKRMSSRGGLRRGCGIGISVAIQGSIGSYSEKVAQYVFGKNRDINGIEMHPCSHFADVFLCLESGAVDFAIVPIENTLVGSFHAVYDGLRKYYRSVTIVREIGLHDSLCLLALPESDAAGINVIYSQQEILNQCPKFLEEKYPKAAQLTTSDSAVACEMLIRKELRNAAAVAPASVCDRWDLRLLDSGIEDDRNSVTRYLILCKNIEKGGEERKEEQEKRGEEEEDWDGEGDFIDYWINRQLRISKKGTCGMEEEEEEEEDEDEDQWGRREGGRKRRLSLQLQDDPINSSLEKSIDEIVAGEGSTGEDNGEGIVGLEGGGDCSTSLFKTSLGIGIKNCSGSLFRLIGTFSLRGINIFKVECRPTSRTSNLSSVSSSRNWEYFYYVDVAGHHERDPALQSALEMVREQSNNRVFVFGSYRCSYIVSGVLEGEGMDSS
eukprot:Nk52_evm1s1609 gene=Nk52_evmTU1s1609